ncbi:nucleotide excision repair endonuclease [Bacillus paranthracis]|uniref:nucleotide excision repair endonuclease n=1 Tax=Bacillus paranthracis TaxID=2026186 RepID=UPI00027A312E|nr:nucleotide excision repair endonuclease [Bacillus paranthracis]EJR42167.1 hypothetical protein IIK_05670 [Bacillus cereus VD102]MCD1182177.1 nucleotide excision repair endonuclease [Bacillus paranthracis]HDR4569044.1 nucleotide excision repair endonuclease [Bacillus paranthracis]
MEELEFMNLKLFCRVVGIRKSGNYLIRDKNKRIIYVGKAVDLKNRVKDHFGGHTNTQAFAMFFDEVAYILEESSIKRSLLEMELIFKHKPICNKEVQEEFPDLYNSYLRENSEAYKKIDSIQQEVREVKALNEKEEKVKLVERQQDEAKIREKLRRDLINIVGGKAIFYDIISYLDNGYNPHFLSTSLKIDIETIKKIQEIRKYLRIPQTHKRTVKHMDLVHAVTGEKETTNKRLNHLL